MKICPACNRAYADETLTYCLDDGSLLSAPYEPEATQRLPLPRATNHTKTGIPLQPSAAAAAVEQSKRSDGSAFKYIVVALLALIAGGGIMGWLNLRNREAPAGDNRPATSQQANPVPSPAVSVPSPSQTGRPSLEIKATASSMRSPEKGITYQPENVLDQSLATAWIEGVSGAGIGEWIKCDFASEVKLNRIIITPGYFKTPDIWKQNNRLAKATFFFSDGSSRQFNFPDRMVEQRLEVGGIKTRWVRMVIDDYHLGSVDVEDTPVSSLVFIWE